MGAFIVVFVRFFVVALWLVMLGRVLTSWTDPRSSGSLGRFFYRTTEPILAPIRRVLPRTGMIDLSPLVVILLLTMLLRMTGLV